MNRCLVPFNLHGNLQRCNPCTIDQTDTTVINNAVHNCRADDVESPSKVLLTIGAMENSGTYATPVWVRRPLGDPNDQSIGPVSAHGWKHVGYSHFSDTSGNILFVDGHVMNVAPHRFDLTIPRGSGEGFEMW